MKATASIDRFCYSKGLLVPFTALLLTACSQVYTPAYVTRVLMHRDASADDFLWKPAVHIPASSNPQEMISAYDADRVRSAFSRNDPSFDIESYLKSAGSTSFLVVKDGQLLYEQYFDGSTREQIQPAFSIAKSILSLLVGSMIHELPSLSMDDPITKYLPELETRDARFSAIDLASLIDMRSGLRYESNVSFPFVNQDPPLIYYATNMRAVLLNETIVESAPGTFHYNDYNPNVLAFALERALGRNPAQLVHERVMDAIGAEYDSLWSSDDQGFLYWESGFAAAPRDLAKLGQLMLDKGHANSGSVIPLYWHERSTTYPDIDLPAALNGRQWAYRNGWWQILRATGPNDYAAIGRFGQMIYISPASKVIIVRTGTDENPPNDADLTALFYAAAQVL